MNTDEFTAILAGNMFNVGLLVMAIHTDNAGAQLLTLLSWGAAYVASVIAVRLNANMIGQAKGHTLASMAFNTCIVSSMAALFIIVFNAVVSIT